MQNASADDKVDKGKQRMTQNGGEGEGGRYCVVNGG